MEDRITELEIKLAHMEQTVAELSDEMAAQQSTIDKLQRTCEVLRTRLQTLDASAAEQPNEEKPPHY